MIEAYGRLGRVEVSCVSTRTVLDVGSAYVLLGKLQQAIGDCEAGSGELGITPGSQGTASHIVCGRGCKDSFESCSHGAGRRMGRKQAQRELSLGDEIRRLDDAGVVHGISSVKDLDEASGAYKDIGQVMMNQTDLVEIVETLRPLGVVKG